jgi:predicted DNA-binding transcriptional regulator YafY
MNEINPVFTDRKHIRFDYVNWRGEKSKRDAYISYIFFGSNMWHEEDQWLMVAFDNDKQETRYFAMKDMSKVEYLKGENK